MYAARKIRSYRNPLNHERLSWWVIMTYIGLIILSLIANRLNAANIPEWIDEPHIREAINSESTIWYNDDILPRVTQYDGRLYPASFDISRGFDRTGNPNNEFPWKETGGLHGAVFGKWLFYYPGPEGKKVMIWPEQITVRLPPRDGGGLDRQTVYHGDFPLGSMVGEFLYSKQKIFEVRVREKLTRENWHTYQFVSDKTPRPDRYIEVANCVQCHEDITKHSLKLDSSRAWYGQIGSLEKDGPMHLHFFNPFPQAGQQVSFNNDPNVRNLYELVRTKHVYVPADPPKLPEETNPEKGVPESLLYYLNPGP